MSRIAALLLAMCLLATWAGLRPAPTSAAEQDSTSAKQQAESDGGGEEIELVPIEVTAKRDKGELERASADVTVIRVAETPAKFRNAAEVLDTVTGVVIRRLGGEGKPAVVSIRGSSASQVLVLLDGVRLTPGRLGGYDMSNIDVSMIDHIEILRGGASALFGSDAVGGVVNIVTKKAAGRPGASLSETTGSFGTYRLSIQASSAGAKRESFTSASAESSVGDFAYTTVNGARLRRGNNDLRGFDLFSKYSTLGGRGRFTITNSFHFAHQGEPGLGEFPSTTAESRSSSLTSDITFEPTPPTSRLRVTYTLRHEMRSQSFQDAHPFFGPPIMAKTIEHTLDASARIRWTPTQRQVVSGLAEARNDRLTSAPFGSPHRTSLLLSGSDEISLAHGRYVISPSASISHASDVGTRFSPQVGLHANLSRRFEANANVGRSFRFPSFDELYFPNEGFLSGNPDLASEVATEADAGVAYKPRWGRIEAAGFASDIENSIVFAPVSAYTIRAENTGRARVRGVEASTRATVTRRLSLDGSYTLTDAHYAASAIPLTGRPKYKATLGADLAAGRAKWTLDLLRESSLPADLFGNITVAGKTMAAASFTYKLSDRIDLVLKGENLLNENARDSRDLPLPGRAFYLTITLR